MSKKPDIIITYKNEHDDKGEVKKIKKEDCNKLKITDKMKFSEIQDLIIKKQKEIEEKKYKK